MNDNYIEVIGEAQYSEEPETWIIDITLNIPMIKNIPINCLNRYLIGLRARTQR